MCAGLYHNSVVLIIAVLSMTPNQTDCIPKQSNLNKLSHILEGATKELNRSTANTFLEKKNLSI